MTKRLRLQLLRSGLKAFNFGLAHRMSSQQVHRGYKEAVLALNSLQTNANVLAAIQAAGPQPASKVLGQTTHYLRRLGYKPDDLNALGVVHISGTKGKGSTAAFCSTLLTTINPEAKVGLFTSPHLVAVRERIRINGKPITEELFAKYFWEVWDRFEDGHGEPALPDLSIRPAYFRYLTCMAYHVFLSERVDATILEVGVGGLLDPTNIVPSPIVTGVTSLGLDHVNVLGYSILEIAGHKGGIFKPGVPALTIEQASSGAVEVLRARAVELKASSFSIVPRHPELDQANLGLAGEHQKINASLALALINTFLASPRLPDHFKLQKSSLPDATAAITPSPFLPPPPTNPAPIIPDISSLPLPPILPSEFLTPHPISDLFRQALQATKWPGRCQIVQDPYKPRISWSLDGAHTVESIACCGKWWRELIRSSDQTGKRALIFNCTSGRSGKTLLKMLKESLDEGSNEKFEFDLVIISTNTTFSSGKSTGDLTCIVTQLGTKSELTVQNEIAEAWKSITSLDTNVIVTRSIEDAVGEIHKIDDQPLNVLVTGSLHLVGGVLEVAQLLDSSFA
ncbi:hypothetical protein CROQUDRAFT_134356 [Cronartium quercuum f. sp. fusiforme G11]|uniref:Folylpolyglutamate synthase n=1 Tax=Cronartium quercuum f. sp. fusiforme G11 TaxID=708437 RepID=A0A9P6NHT3_9BASI|nr:hypothetical protein CROQUDRAFT_134356 [Cronartium quercuum f. sp. fusiforme G11]